MLDSFYNQYGKRAFDFFVSILGLVFLSPLFVSVAIIIKLSSKGKVFYAQQRIGRDFKKFYILKFRSMREEGGLDITSGNDPRITAIGKVIRKTKIDELPQLFNVLKGEMSLVGPRPEVEKYVNIKKDEYVKVLRVRPGITDLAAIEFRDEELILSKFENIEQGYIDIVLPKKIKFYQKYIQSITFASDISIILKTLKVI